MLVRIMKQQKAKQSRIKISMNPNVKGALISRKPQPAPAQKKFAKMSPSKRAAKRYRERDARAAFFRPRAVTRSMTRAKRKRKQQHPKQKKRCLTDKQRAAWAREHYQQHHGTDNLTFSPPAILGHHQHQLSAHPIMNATMTTLTAQELLHFYDNRNTDHSILHNLSNTT